MLSLIESRSDKYIVSIELSSLNEGTQKVALTTPVRRKVNYWMTKQYLSIVLSIVTASLVFATRHQGGDMLVSFVNFSAGRSIKY
jgi:hypothetical protein